jgi:transcriptional regulator with XRE-family HTH domain
MSSEIDKKTYLLEQMATRLRVERTQMGMSQSDLADACGVSRVSWGMYERGKAWPGADVMMKLAFLGCDIYHLMTGRGSPSQAKLSEKEDFLISSYRSANEQGKLFIEQACTMSTKA